MRRQLIDNIEIYGLVFKIACFRSIIPLSRVNIGCLYIGFKGETGASLKGNPLNSLIYIYL